MLDRRDFLQGLGAWPLMASLAQGASKVPSEGNSKIFVFLFLPGAWDGLAVLAPIEDPHYARYRPHIALSLKADAKPIALEHGYFLHPALSPMQPLWKNGEALWIANCGSSNGTRSHFEAQDAVERGLVGKDRNRKDGFLNRSLKDYRSGMPVLQAVGFQKTLPLSLVGDYPALCVDNLKRFGLRGNAEKQESVYESMYAATEQSSLKAAGALSFAAQDVIKKVLRTQKNLGRYPQNPQAKHFQDLAALVKAKVGLKVATLSWGGWDTHVNQGAGQGTMARNLSLLSETIAAFRADLKDHWADITLVGMSEFGRTVRENGSRGTDHGHGSAAFVLGGDVKSQRLLGEAKGLSEEHLYEGRDLPVHVDFRRVLDEALLHSLGPGIGNPFSLSEAERKPLGLFRV